ncbi:hypothetical protein Tco_0512343 [Tanacetum coccineum]
MECRVESLMRNEVLLEYEEDQVRQLEEDMRKTKDTFMFLADIIMESLVKKKQKGAILKLKGRHLKKVIFYTYTPYPAMRYAPTNYIRISARLSTSRCVDPIPIGVKMDDPNITMEEYIRLEDEKAHRRGKVYNWETATYGKIWCDEDVHDLRSVETEFPTIVFNDALKSEVALSCEPTVNLEDDNDKVNVPSFPSPKPTVSYFDDLDFFKDFENEFLAIVYKDALTSKLDFLTEPSVSPQHIDEFDLKDETSLSKCDEEEQNVLCFNDLFPFNVIYPNDSKSDKDNNDDDKIDIKHSSGGNVMNTDDGAYAQRSNKLLEISHDTSNKFFKTETFIKELNFNIMT